MKRDTLNTWTRWVDDPGCTRCFQHKDLQRKMLQSTLKDTDALDVVDLVDLHGRFRHNRASTSASHHLNLPLHNSPWNSGRRLSFLDWTWLEHILTPQSKFDPLWLMYGFVSFDKHSHCEAAPTRLSSISKHWPLNKTYQTSPDTLETRPPKTRNPAPTWLHLITLESVESLGKRLSTCRWVLRPPPGEVWYTANRYGLLSEKIASGGT